MAFDLLLRPIKESLGQGYALLQARAASSAILLPRVIQRDRQDPLDRQPQSAGHYCVPSGSEREHRLVRPGNTGLTQTELASGHSGRQGKGAAMPADETQGPTLVHVGRGGGQLLSVAELQHSQRNGRKRIRAGRQYRHERV